MSLFTKKSMLSASQLTTSKYNSIFWLLLLQLLLLKLNTIVTVEAKKGKTETSPSNKNFIQKKVIIDVLNKSKKSLDVFWMNPENGMLVAETNSNKKGQFLHNNNLSLNSYIGHKFEVRELPSVQTGECGDSDDDDDDDRNICHSVQFTVVENYRKYIINDNWEIQPVGSDSAVIMKVNKKDALSECQEKSKIALKDTSSSSSTTETLDELIECIEKVVSEEVTYELHRVQDRQSELLAHVGTLWGMYNCNDTTDNEEEQQNIVRKYSWDDKDDSSYPDIKVLLDKPNSQIHYIPNFISQEECQIFTDTATPKLKRSAVASDDGGSKVTDSFKAKTSYVKVPHSNVTHPITRTSNRIFQFTNHVLQDKNNEFKITYNGQELPMFVQYNGNKTSPDKYLPHVDFAGTTKYNHTHKHSTRIASMLMYCSENNNYKMNFQNIGLSIKPKQYSAIFVSYINPSTFKMDDDDKTDGDENISYTLKRSCPLYDGQMNVVTQYVRYGVDDELPWTAYDNLGMKKSDVDV